MHPDTPSQQIYRSPTEFLAAVQRKFNVEIAFDLACTREDCVVPSVSGQGLNGFPYPQMDALTSPWPRLADGHVAYANPPFNRSGAFARVASESPHCRTLMLIPASVGTKWWAEHVDGQALVVFLRPRIVFLQPDGTPCPAGINRDCALLAYGWPPAYVCSDWRTW